MTHRWQKGLYAASWVLFLLFGFCVSFHAWDLHDLEDAGGKYANYGYVFSRLPGNEQPNNFAGYYPPWTHAQVIAERNRLNDLYARDLWEDSAPLFIMLLVLIVVLPVQRHLLIQRGRDHSPQRDNVRQNSVRFTLWMLFILFALGELYFANALYNWTGIGRYEDYASERQFIATNEQPGFWNDSHPLITHEQANAQRAQLDVLYRRELWERSYPLVIALLILAVALLIQQYLLTRGKRRHPPPTLAVQAS